MNLKEKALKLPSSPGVYLMKDSLGNIIYVGKSKNLKSRVGSYFQNLKSHSPKVIKLVKNIKDFEYILTDTEFEALILECKLIREIKPRYNAKMKNSHSYSYIKINTHGKYPEIEISDEPNPQDESIYFGPYTSRNIVEKGLLGIKESCKILCSSPSRKSSPCLNYSLDLCMGICLDNTPKEKYLSIFEKILNLFNKKDKSILEEIEYKMKNAANKFDFEKATKYRDYLNAVNYLLSQETIVEFTKENKNIALIEYLDEDNLKFFLIKGNKIVFKEKYKISNYDIEQLKSILKCNILSYSTDKNLKNPVTIRKEEIDESQIIYSYLKSNSTKCRYSIIEEKWLQSPYDKKINSVLHTLIT